MLELREFVVDLRGVELDSHSGESRNSAGYIECKNCPFDETAILRGVKMLSCKL